MAITEEKLLAAGFTLADVQKLKNNLDNYGGSFEQVIQGLSNRFRANIWITAAVVVVCLTVLFGGSLGDAASAAVAALIALAIVWFTVPIPLAYRAWSSRKQSFNSQDVP
ncbi:MULTISPECIES: hypothetical protein [Serratia]|uniref:hypothetical protein n=1 Tax=Serratia TaxID=613 RepID=UPI000A153DDD|nr:MULTISPECIES: hypothetical protein [Serratia]TFZ52533.1 hypothetical protein E5C26_04820 [Serratia proteamaculans]CAI1577279.1 Uncharacterised protein [Serratia quinivorans]CAI1655694.1 Uncharacterised protein [Serratia quinivorans]